MAVNADRGYEIDGTLNIGGVSFYIGSTPPYDIPVANAPIDSIYMQGNGAIWTKTGAGDLEADWNLVLTALPLIVTVNDEDYSVAVGVGLVRVKAITGDVTIELPSASVERIITVKVVLNPADKYNVWLTTVDSSLIEDEEDAVIMCKGTSVTLWANGTDWEIT